MSSIAGPLLTGDESCSLWTALVPLAVDRPGRRRLRPAGGPAAGERRGPRADRLRARLGAPRRGRRAPRRRAVRHPDPRRRRHRDRGGADRLDDAGRRPRQVGAAARHDLLGDHDHLQRRGRPLRRGRRPAPPRAVVSPRGRDRRARRADRPGDALARPADLHDQLAGCQLHPEAARLRSGRIARAVGRLRVRADGPPSRLLPAAGAARPTSRRTRRRLR